MDSCGKILLVDDNKSFVSSTSKLIIKNGFACDCEYDGSGAVHRLREGTYDILIADIRMSGNENLELLEEAEKHPGGLPVILVTGHPTLETAIRSIKSPVTAYMVKPFGFEELVRNVESALAKSRMRRKVSTYRTRINSLGASLEELEELIAGLPADESSLPMETFVKLTTQNLIDSVLDLKNLIISSDNEHASHICQLYRCPRVEMIKRSIKDSIDVLEQTKKSFKSKELALLRKKLQDLMSEV